MSRIVRIPFPYRPYAGGASEVPADGATPRELLTALAAAYPPLRRHLFTDAGGTRSTVHLFAGGRELAGPDQALGDAQAVELVPSIAGGGPGRGGLELNRVFSTLTDHSEG